MTKYNKVAVGGTFDKFHNGHKLLIKTAIEHADEVLIGITSDDFASYKNHDVDSYDLRSERIINLLKNYDIKYQIKQITDVYGTADVDPELDAIVVSSETEQAALKINDVRADNGLSPLDIIVIDWVLADDGIPISSTRIRKGEIDKKGKIL